MTVVIISTLTFVLSTMPELAEEIDVVLFDNETDSGEVAQERCLCVCLSNLISFILIDNLTMLCSDGRRASTH